MATVCDFAGCGRHAIFIDLSLDAQWCEAHVPADFHRKESVDVEKAEAQERPSQERQAERTDAHVLTAWEAKPYPGGRFMYELTARYGDKHFGPRRALVWIEPRPTYCDRGRWIANVDGIASIDHADAFPRYYMELTRAKLEMEAWLRWRLWKE